MAKPKPVAEVRIGRVKAAIWSNDTEGGTRHNVTRSNGQPRERKWHLGPQGKTRKKCTQRNVVTVGNQLP